MIHYTCDRCQRKIDAESLRYSVEMKMQAEFDQIDIESPDEDRQLEQMQEILAGLSDTDSEELVDAVFHRLQFDLCNICYHEFKSNPLGVPKVRFSQN